MPAASAREYIARCMGLACAEWGWSADDFWRATPFDIHLICKGRALLQRGDFTATDAAELRALLDKKI